MKYKVTYKFKKSPVGEWLDGHQLVEAESGSKAIAQACTVSGYQYHSRQAVPEDMSGAMKLSMNGFRGTLSDQVTQLREIVKAVLADEYYEKDDLIEVVNDIICSSNCLNCIYLPGSDLFVDMSDLEVEQL